jgi:cytochrome c-type biogenesis protein CcmF
MSDSFALRAVYEHSSKSLPLVLKLSASWTGSGGSLLLWLTMMTIATLASRLSRRHPMNNERVSGVLMSFFTMVVLAFTLLADPFRQLSVSVPDGLGQSPSLRTFWSVVHPPLVFAAYTAILLSYAVILGRRWTLKAEPYSADDRMLWASWILLSLAISLGGVWAYETLGWGGYWAWDPIETAALIPWLSMTALLFSRPVALGEDYDLFSITFSASAVFFTVYVARASTALSLHGYGSFIGGIFIVIMAILPMLISLVTARKFPFHHAKENDLLTESAFWMVIFIGWANLLLLSYESFASLFGVVAHINPLLHNYVSFPMLIVFLAVVIARSIKKHSSNTVAFFCFALLLLIGVAVSSLNILTGNPLADVGMPFVLVLLAAATYRLIDYVFRRPRFLHRYASFRFLIFLGLALLLFGVFVSSSMQSSATATVSTGQEYNVSGLKLSIIEITTFPSDRQIFLPPYGMRPDSIDTKIIYTLGDAPSDYKVLVLSYYPAFDRFMPTPSIFRSIMRDTYVSASVTDAVREATASVFANGTEARPADVMITIKTIPAVSLVWLGVTTMVVGSLPFAFVRRRIQETLEDLELGWKRRD